MTTATTVGVMDQTSDVAFRNWIAEIIAQLIAVGLTQTADTGQINTSTVVRTASAQTAQGYAIFRFNDSLQSTSPIFFKLEFGTGSTAVLTCPAMWITVGTGSNGSGTLTGTTSGRCPAGVNVNLTGAVTSNWISRYCYSTAMGAFAVCFKIGAGATTAPFAFFGIFRSNDSTGAPTADSYMLLSNGGAAATGTTNTNINAINYSYNTSGLVTEGVSTNWAYMPYGNTTTLINGNVQLGAAWHLQPTAKVSGNVAIALRSEFPPHTQCTIALLGSSTYTFLSTGILSNGDAVAGNTGCAVMMPWQ